LNYVKLRAQLCHVAQFRVKNTWDLAYLPIQAKMQGLIRNYYRISR